jgi:hypothetical protein
LGSEDWVAINTKRKQRKMMIEIAVKTTAPKIFLLVIFGLAGSAIYGQAPVSVLVEPVASPTRAASPATPAITAPADEPLSADAVRSSIKRAVQYLKSKQGNDGSWVRYRSPGDVTALTALALLNAEVDANDPKIESALRHIQTISDEQLTTYFVSLRIMALAAADPNGEKYRRAVAQDVKWLLEMQVPKNKGKHAGGWSYGQAQTAGADASNSQFALLALHEASRMGVKTPAENWKLAAEYWMGCFDQGSGGFAYTVNGGGVRGSMTCAGISSWIIIQENLAQLENEINGDRAKCCGNDAEMKPVEKAIQWLADNYSVRSNPTGYQRGNGNQLYYLYGMERAGRLAGRRFFGPHDWYRDGAKQLISQQNRLAGSWTNSEGQGEEISDVATSLALLFLANGKRPVAVGKFKYSESEDWDPHPKGIHYLTRRLESQWKQKLNWQTVTAKNATVDDLLEAPVLFLSGTDSLKLSLEEKRNLKKYLENGGFLFAEACQGEGCGNPGFAKQFAALLADPELFPDSQLEALAPDHPIWNAHYPLLPNEERPLLGLQACCRTNVVYCPTNLSCYWALDRPAIEDFAKANRNTRLLNRIEYCSRVGVNVVTYATGRKVYDKDATPKLMEEASATLTDRVLVFPKLIHGGGSDDAPNAWRNVLREIQSAGLRIKLDKQLITPDLDSLADYPFVFLHGRNRFQFSNEQRSALKTYLELGGFVFADSICSSPQFTQSFRSEMKTILGQPLSAIDPSAGIWSERFGYKIETVTLRTKDPKSAGGFRKSVRRPELEGWQQNGRWVVVFSPHDLSCALENTAVSQCDGYTKSDAIKIGTNVILYSLLSDVGESEQSP